MKYAILDTNTFLHFQLFIEIDWQSFLSADEVTLIVSSTVLQELDKKKYSEQDIRIKNRAKKVINTFNQILEKQILFKKEKSQLHFLTSEPAIDWKNENLDSSIPDDRIIATCIEMHTQHNDVVLITADFGLKLKAKNKSINVLELPGEYLLKEKQSKEQAELQDLREKVIKLESTFPKLSLMILNGENPSSFIKYEISKQAIYPEAKYEREINEKVNEVLILAENKITQNTNPLLGNLGGIRQEDFDEFKKKLDKYKNELYEYYRNLWEYEGFLSRLVEINFLISNDGNTPGKDIDVNIHFPDGFKIFDLDELPNKPNEPKSPDTPMTLAESMQSLISPTYFNFPHWDYIGRNMMNISPQQRNFSGPSIKKTNSYNVSYHINSLKHKTSHKLDTIYLYFESYTDINSFSVDYNLLAANYPEKFEGKLNLIFNTN